MPRSVKENLKAWRVLNAIQIEGGLSEAAFSLGLDTARCSRLIANLEEEIGFPLIDHQHRPSSLTHQARHILPYVRDFLLYYDRLQQACLDGKTMSLTLRLSIPVNIPRYDTHAIIKAYEHLDPGLNLEIVSDADHEDVSNGRVDAAYLPYHPKDDSLLLWPICEVRNCMLAAPDYLKRNGYPMSPQDLIDHDLILRSARHYPATTFLTNGSAQVPLANRRVAFSGDVASGREAVLAGAGIAVDLSFHAMKSEIESGRLVPVLVDWHRPKWHTCLVVSKINANNIRLIRFCRWYAHQESKAAKKRCEEVQAFVRSQQPGQSR